MRKRKAKGSNEKGYFEKMETNHFVQTNASFQFRGGIGDVCESLTQSWSNYDLICHDFSSILKETSGSHYGLLCRDSLVPVRSSLLLGVTDFDICRCGSAIPGIQDDYRLRTMKIFQCLLECLEQVL